MKAFARIPDHILSADYLSNSDKLVYGRLAVLERNGVISGISHKKIAKDCVMNRRTVRRSLKILEEKGHLQIEHTELGACASYRLTDAIFKREKRVLAPCGKCGLACVPGRTTGWCRKCVSAAREDRRQAGIRANRAFQEHSDSPRGS